MAKHTRAFDWATTPLGPQDAWPQSLRTALDMMLGSAHAMCLAWGPDRTLLYNDGYAPVLGARHPDALGRPLAEVWPELWHDIEPLVARTFRGDSVSFRAMPLTMTRNGYEEETWWDFAYSPVHDEAGAVAGLFNVTLDVTDRVRAEQTRDRALAKLAESERFLSSVLAASTDCIKVVELDGTVSFMSEGGMRTMEVDDFASVRGCPWPDFLKGEGAGRARDALEAARQGRSSHFEAHADTLKGTAKYWSVSVSPITDEAGEVVRVLSVSRDHTALHRAREQQHLLNGELAHRMKNTMSVVQAIASQTLRDANQDVVEAFTHRLAALASAHDVLLRQDWAAAALREVARSIVRTFGGDDRFMLDGPDVQLGPRATLALSLMLHELSTNAAKYGALSLPDGRVTIRWEVAGSGQDQRLVLRWQERGGPPAVQPTRRGFGSRIIRMGLIGSGGVDLAYETEGLTVVASAPLHQILDA